MPNLCGVNQKMLGEALEKIRKNQGGATPSPSQRGKLPTSPEVRYSNKLFQNVFQLSV